MILSAMFPHKKTSIKQVCEKPNSDFILTFWSCGNT